MEELKQRMSYREALLWFDYARTRGLRHADRLLATIAAQINQLAGGGLTPADFLPALQADTGEASAADILQILTGTS